MESAETAADVFFGFFDAWVAEYFRGVGALDEFAHVEEGGLVGNARSLLHIMGDDDEGIVTF
jgi:hypothetical protein